MNAVAQPNIQELILWLLRRRHRFRVDGESMNPTLESGDYVLADIRHYRTNRPKIGEIVVFKHPYETRVLVKRISDVDGTRFAVRGDNGVQSSDSRSFGWLSRDALLGRVTSRIHR